MSSTSQSSSQSLSQPTTTLASKLTSNTSVPAIDKMCRILDLITTNNIALSAAQIAANLQLPRSSTHTILQSLLSKHLVYKDRDNRYHLGSYLLYWAGKYEHQHSIIQVFHELVNQHPVLLKHTVTLTKLDDKEVVFLACHDSPAPLGFTFHTGIRVPAAFSATGKAMLATFDDDELTQLFTGAMPEPLTAYSVKTFEALMQELDSIRQTGISLDNGQLREGMYCLGTCIRDSEGSPIAGMAVSLVQQEYEHNKDSVSRALNDLADEIAEQLLRI